MAAKNVYYNIGSGAPLATASITLTPSGTGLASSATVGRQGTAITLADASNRVAADGYRVRFWSKLTTGTIGSDRAVYLFLARSMNGTTFEGGKPAVSGTDGAYTFASSPVGTTPVSSGIPLFYALPFNAQSESAEMTFFLPPCRAVVPIVLNFSGIALTNTSSDHGIEIYRNLPEIV